MRRAGEGETVGFGGAATPLTNTADERSVRVQPNGYGLHCTVHDRRCRRGQATRKHGAAKLAARRVAELVSVVVSRDELMEFSAKVAALLHENAAWPKPHRALPH